MNGTLQVIATRSMNTIGLFNKHDVLIGLLNSIRYADILLIMCAQVLRSLLGLK